MNYLLILAILLGLVGFWFWRKSRRLWLRIISWIGLGIVILAGFFLLRLLLR